MPSSLAPVTILVAERREYLGVVLESAKGSHPVVLVEEHFEELALIEIKQVAEDLKQAVEMIHLLLHVNAAIVLITLVFLHRLCRFLVLLLYLVEYFLEFIEVKAAPCLQLRMIPVAKL